MFDSFCSCFLLDVLFLYGDSRVGTGFWAMCWMDVVPDREE